MENEIFRRPLKRKSPRVAAGVMASQLVPIRPGMQAQIVEEMVSEALARTGARSLEELRAKMKVEGKVARQLRRQVVPRLVDPRWREVQMVTEKEKVAAEEKELPASVQLAIRNVQKAVTRARTAFFPMELRAEMRARQALIDGIDKAVAKLKAIAQQMGVSERHPAVKAAIDDAMQERYKQQDRVLALQQMMGRYEEERR